MKTIKYLIALCLIVLSFSLQAAEPQFEFGQLTGVDCYNSECEIKFQKHYEKEPLVFLMSTIENNGRDAPSTLHVVSVDKTKAKIKQYLAPYTDRVDSLGFNQLDVYEKNESCDGYSYCLNKRPNTTVNYFVIEEGEVNLGSKGRIKAGLASVDRYVIGGTTPKNNQLNRVVYGSGFNNPGVIVSIQGNKKDMKKRESWITPVVTSINNESFKVALDHSEVNNWDVDYQLNYSGKSRDVAYLIVEGSGSYKGLQFVLGRGVTLNTLKKGLKGFDQITEPVITQCNGFIDINGSSTFTETPFILASKSSRKGNNGGWLRMCQLKKKNGGYAVSFVNDEDLNEWNKASLERKHASENIGFMAFQRKVSEDVCEIFTGVAQTWKSSLKSSVEIDDGAQILNVPQGKKIGYYPDGRGSKFDVHNRSCGSNSCESSTAEMIDNKPSLDTFPSTSGEIEFDHGVKTTTKFNYSKIELGGSAQLYLEPGEYWVDKVELKKGSRLHVNGFVKLNVKSFKADGGVWVNEASGSQYGNPDSLVILSHKDDVELEKGARVSALIYSESEIKMDGGARLYGAVTTNELKLEAGSKIIGHSACFDVPPTYRLEITPDKKDKVLACDGEEITFSVIDETTNKVADNFTGSLEITAPVTSPENADVCWFDSALAPTGTCPSKITHWFNSETGSVKYKLSSKDLASINIQAKLTSHGDVTETAGAYTFVPFALAIENKDFVDNVPFGQIAGREFSWDIVAKAKSGNSRSCDVMEGYTGERKLTVSHSQLPNTAGVKLKIKANKSGSALREAKGDFDFTFEKGKAAGNKGIYPEAGRVTLALKDKAFEGKPSEMTASEDFYFRPFALALCDWNDKSRSLFKGDASSGVGLAKAGEHINFYAKPLAWMGSGNASNDPFKTPIVNKNEDDYCGQTALTQFVDDTVQTDLNVGVYSLDTPIDGLLGSNVFSVDAKFKAGSEYGKGIVSWGDVGSFKVGLGSDDYLKKGFAVPPAPFRIGRIYPAYFELTSSAVENAHPANSLTGFTYMNQGWSYDFTLTAKANGYTEATTNYSKFAESLKAKVNVALVDGDAALKANNDWRSRVTPTMSTGLINWNKATISKSVSDVNFTRRIDPKKSSATVTDKRTFPNMKVVLYSKGSDHTDPIDYRSSPQNLVTDSETFVGSALAGQLDARYGRMALDDVGTAFDKTVTVPMRVEYWDGQKFILNTDDSYSPFDGGNYCKQMIWPADSANSKSVLQGNGTHVTTGKTLDIQANPNRTDYYREQVRFWHKLVSTPPKAKAGEQTIACPAGLGVTKLPWLTYNWRGEGDESPSTVVTFGVYRGNDRIIYRGEKGMTALPN